ncbi:MAG: hypothetical protein ACYC3I_22445 [Gemmataceae bacterium]
MPIVSRGQLPSNGIDAGITMMIAVCFASLLRNGQQAHFESVPQVLSLQVHLPFSQQHSPPLPHSHLLSLQQVQPSAHLLFLQQHSPALQHLPALQQLPHLPALQQLPQLTLPVRASQQVVF